MLRGCQHRIGCYATFKMSHREGVLRAGSLGRLDTALVGFMDFYLALNQL